MQCIKNFDGYINLYSSEETKGNDSKISYFKEQFHHIR